MGARLPSFPLLGRRKPTVSPPPPPKYAELMGGTNDEIMSAIIAMNKDVVRLNQDVLAARRELADVALQVGLLAAKFDFGTSCRGGQ